MTLPSSTAKPVARPISLPHIQSGTTADIKIAFMELHRIGPTKIMDTPGIDEEGVLGEKKRIKAFNALRESDIALIVVDPFNPNSIKAGRDLVAQASERVIDKELAGGIVFNLRKDLKSKDESINTVLEAAEADMGFGDDPPFPTIAVDLSTKEASTRLFAFLESHSSPRASQVSLLPPGVDNLLHPDSIVLLNIPMDDETPGGRLLRPQAVSQEALLRNYVTTVAYRMDLKKGRSEDAKEREEEEKRFRDTVEMLGPRLKLVITDSQAMDLTAPWTLKNGKEVVPLTTFSIMMINYLSGGRLSTFVDGLKKFDEMPDGSKMLICEACNHDRIQDDIGTVQIPNKVRQHYGDKIGMDTAFGREYQTKQLSEYKLVVHCGGCMLDQQKMSARLEDIEATGVSVTNYGLLLSYFQSTGALTRVLKPWNLTYPPKS